MEDWQIELENYMSKNFDDITHEKKTVDFDMEKQVINVAYRLPNNILLSITKPYHTLGNDEVGFNLYQIVSQIKELLIADWCLVGLLHKYIKNVEEKIWKIKLS